MNLCSEALLAARDCFRKAHQGEALPADSSQELPIWCGSNVSVKPHLLCMYMWGRTRECKRGGKKGGKMKKKKATTNKASWPCYLRSRKRLGARHAHAWTRNVQAMQLEGCSRIHTHAGWKPRAIYPSRALYCATIDSRALQWQA